MANPYGCLGAILCLCVVGVTSEVRFVCPRPQSANSALTQGPCGKNSFTGSFRDDFMEVRPGPLTLRLEDTVNRPGSPSRISLGQWGNDPTCVLLDHIPYPDRPDTAATKAHCPTSGYPLGQCNRTRYLTVDIPDIACDKCYLQIMTVLTPSKGVCYEIPNTQSVNCTTYYSCANVRIRPTAKGANNTLLECVKYSDNLQGYWPYIETVHSQAVFTEEFMRNSHVTVSVDDYYLSYDIVLGGEIKIHTGYDYMSIVFRPRNNTVFMIPLKKLKFSGKIKAFTTLVSDLKNGRLAVKFALTQPAKVFYTFALKVTGNSFAKGMYGRHRETYSQGGWLESPDFIGADATYPSVLTPAGVCAPDTLAYGTLLRDNDNILRGIVNHNILDDTVHMAGIFSNKIWFPYPIVYQTQQVQPRVEAFRIPQAIFNRDILLSAVLPFTSKSPELLTKVTVEVSVSDSKTLLTGNVAKSIKIEHPIENTYFAIHAIMFPVDGPTWNVTVMIIRKGVYTRQVDATAYLRLPSHDIPVSRDRGDGSGRWVGTASVTVINSSVPMYLWMGYMSLHTQIKYDTQVFQMPAVQFEPLRKWHCNDILAQSCWKAWLWPASGGSRHDEVVPTHAIVTLFLPAQNNRLMYTVTLLESRSMEKITQVVLSDPAGTVILNLAFGTASRHQGKSLTVDGLSVMSPKDLASVMAGHTTLSVHTSHSVITGQIPAHNTVSPYIPIPIYTTPTTPVPTSPASSIAQIFTTQRPRSNYSSTTKSTSSAHTSKMATTIAVIANLLTLTMTSTYFG